MVVLCTVFFNVLAMLKRKPCFKYAVSIIDPLD